MLKKIAACSLVVALTALMTCATTQASTTTATIYQAFRSNGSPAIATHSKSGYCWTGSGTIDRNDAWRCLVANNILDPCFSSAHAKGVVLCPIAPWEKSEIEIHLTKPLAHNGGDNRKPSLHAQPWAVELEGGQRCVFSSGASNAIKGRRLNYFCGAHSTEGLWGFPVRSSQPWTIYQAPFSATTLSNRVAIRHAWM